MKEHGYAVLGSGNACILVKSRRFPKPSIRIPNGTEDIGGSVVPEEVTKELYLIEGARDEDVAFIERVTINDEMDSSWDIQHLGVADMPSGMAGTFRALDKSQGLRLLGYLCLRPDIAFAVGKLSRYTSNPSTQHWQAFRELYTDVSCINNTKDNSSTSGWVFLLNGGAISWVSKKQTCITSSIMESQFMALVVLVRMPEWFQIRIEGSNTWNTLIIEYLNVNYTKLGRIVGNLVQLWVQFIPGYGTEGWSRLP
ncbi:hypothetical protein Tco_0563700 [Tanacetum coccineum]